MKKLFALITLLSPLPMVAKWWCPDPFGGLRGGYFEMADENAAKQECGDRAISSPDHPMKQPAGSVIN